jgi:hypothetical protein
MKELVKMFDFFLRRWKLKQLQKQQAKMEMDMFEKELLLEAMLTTEEYKRRLMELDNNIEQLRMGRFNKLKKLNNKREMSISNIQNNMGEDSNDI